MRVSSLVEFIIHFFHNQVVSFSGGRSRPGDQRTSKRGAAEVVRKEMKKRCRRTGIPATDGNALRGR